VKERPILFSAPMVRAILEGRKTQTRRIVKPQPSPCGLRKLSGGDITATGLDASYWYGSDPFTEARKCPYGVPGDRLWVQETWCHIGSHSGPHTNGKSIEDVRYRADGEGCVWRPSIFMPRWASRITLEIEAVRVERLIEIRHEDCIAEGVSFPQLTDDDIDGSPDQFKNWGRGAYRSLWESINGPGSWDDNPWVWVIQFRRITP